MLVFLWPNSNRLMAYSLHCLPFSVDKLVQFTNNNRTRGFVAVTVCVGVAVCTAFLRPGALREGNANLKGF